MKDYNNSVACKKRHHSLTATAAWHRTGDVFVSLCLRFVRVILSNV